MSSSHNGKKSDRSSNHCKTCGSHDSACKCQFKAPKRKAKPLTSDCIVVDSVICSKKVQKIAEGEFSFSFSGDVENVNIEVTVHEDRISQNIVVIKDKIVNIGIVPITLTVTPIGDTDDPPNIFEPELLFQKETECPGVCPGDVVTETRLQVEAVIVQTIRESFDGFTRFQPIVKIILRTTITATRPVIKSKDGCFIDVTKDRCEPPTSLTIQPPLLVVNVSGFFGGLLGFGPDLSAGNPTSLMRNEILKNLISQRNDTNSTPE